MKEIKYCELKIGDKFKIEKEDKKIFVREKEGALLIIDKYGYPCAMRNDKAYFYLDMPVFVEVYEESEGK